MWVSTKAQYGMKALVELALSDGEPVSLKTVAERQSISRQYLEQIFSQLRRAGIVDSVRGARGGYKLSRPLDEIDALEVVELLEGSVAPVKCLEGTGGCRLPGQCSTEYLWRRVDSAVRSVLRNTTLADLVQQRLLLGSLHAGIRHDGRHDGSRDVEA